MNTLVSRFFAYLITIILFLAVMTQPALAQESDIQPQENIKTDRYKAKIIFKSTSECAFETDDAKCYLLGLEILNGDKEGQEITIDIEESARTHQIYEKGDKVFIQNYQVAGEEQYSITGPDREFGLMVLIVLFVIATIMIGGRQGLGSIIGLGISVFVLFGMTIPMVLDGWNPIIAGFLGASIVLATSIYLSHGFNSKSTVALASTFVGLIIISLLTALFISLAKLTGFGNEEAFFLINQLEDDINMKGILFASIMVAGIGLIDDVTVNQVSSLQEIFKANPKLDRKYLFKSSMNIGKDHIASMVNTLFIAYAGASMPLIMLFKANDVSFREIINNEMFTEEIVRTFVGSIGLILIVPITSFVASYLITWKDRPRWLFRNMSEEHIKDIVPRQMRK